MAKLTDTAIRNAKAREKPYKLPDAGGLVLEVRPTGAKLWRVRFQFAGKPRTFAAGVYPEVTLAAARLIAVKVKADARAGRDPVHNRQEAEREAAEVATQTFEKVARDWMKERAPRWSTAYAVEVKRRLVKDVFPHIGKRPPGELAGRAMVGTPENPGWFRVLRDRSPSGARFVHHHLTEIFAHAAAQHLVPEDFDPARALRGLVRDQTTTPRPATTDLDTARRVLAVIEAKATPVVALAHRFLVLTGVRSREALEARWSEVSSLDGEAPMWTIPAARMKMGRIHHVPLSGAAVEVLRAMRKIRLDDDDLIFSIHGRGRLIARTTIGKLYRRCELPVEQVLHGWRSTMSTVLNDRFPNSRAAIDVMLAHKTVGGPEGERVSAVEGVYNRAQYVEQRRDLAERWAGLILKDAPSAAALSGAASVAIAVLMAA